MFSINGNGEEELAEEAVLNTKITKVDVAIFMWYGWQINIENL